jgi:hypothetical protein
MSASGAKFKLYIGGQQTMNSVETIERSPTLREQRDERRKPAGAAAGRVKLADRYRRNAMVAWNPDWQVAVLTAVRKLGLAAALTDTARAEVERCLSWDEFRPRF